MNNKTNRRVIPETPPRITIPKIPSSTTNGRIIPETPLSTTNRRIIPETPRNKVNKILKEHSLSNLKKVCERVSKIVSNLNNAKYKTPKNTKPYGIVPETPINNIEEVKTPFPGRNEVRRKLHLPTNKKRTNQI